MDDEPLEQQILKMQAVGRDLKVTNDQFREGLEKNMSNAARFWHAADEIKRLERENALIKGREYNDPDRPNGDWPAPPGAIRRHRLTIARSPNPGTCTTRIQTLPRELKSLIGSRE